MSLPKPYYEEKNITIYHADCRDILPHLEPVDLVLTDPPYPDHHILEYKYNDEIIDFLKQFDCQQFIFWSAKRDFPLSYSSIHIWDKMTGAACEYERIFERNGGRRYCLFRGHRINSTVSAQFAKDIFTGHPSQKPIKLIMEIINSAESKSILDPFMGSGTTLVAAKLLGRKAIGIEIEEKYCEISVKRLAQEVFDFK